MLQAQLRAFIPLMLKYSTGRGKPGWGKESTKPNLTLLQAQLRAFIPLMLKYSTGRGKPGWGKESTKPPWWPKHVPWANVRMDARTDEEKTRVRK